MTLNIKDLEVHRLANAISQLTGESLTGIVREALRERQLGPVGSRQMDLLLRTAGILIEPVSVEQAEIARQAYLDYGKGRHAAGLNFGDCVFDALAKEKREPLLFKGKDFSKTDIPVAG